MSVSLIADIGGTHISVFPRNEEGESIAKPVTAAVDSSAGREEILIRWSTAINQAIELCPNEPKRAVLALPGPFDYEQGIGLYQQGGKYGALRGCKVGDELAKWINYPIPLSFVNDADCYGLGEAHFGAGRDFGRQVVITLGTGIGSAFIADGVLVNTGSTIPAGGELWNQPFGQSIADDYFSTRWFLQRVRDDLGLDFPGVREIMAEVPTEYQKRLMNLFSQQLSSFLAPHLSTFGAEALVVGGSIARAWDTFGPSLALHLPDVHVVQGKLGRKAVGLGGARYQINSHLNL